MGEVQVINKTCEYFGGSTYDTPTRSYRNPTVSHLGAVRRGLPTVVDENDYFIGQPPGTASGSMMVILSPEGQEFRVAMAGATDGLKQCDYALEMRVYIMSTEGYAEDVQDFMRQLRDDIIAKIRLDRTLGSGGFEAGEGVDAEAEVDDDQVGVAGEIDCLAVNSLAEDIGGHSRLPGCLVILAASEAFAGEVARVHTG